MEHSCAAESPKNKDTPIFRMNKQRQSKLSCGEGIPYSLVIHNIWNTSVQQLVQRVKTQLSIEWTSSINVNFPAEKESLTMNITPDNPKHILHDSWLCRHRQWRHALPRESINRLHLPLDFSYAARILGYLSWYLPQYKSTLYPRRAQGRSLHWNHTIPIYFNGL